MSAENVDNADRAERGRRLLAEYVTSQASPQVALDVAGARLVPLHPSLADLDSSEGEWLGDMLADILHFAVVRGIDCHTLLERAMNYVKEEVEEES